MGAVFSACLRKVSIDADAGPRVQFCGGGTGVQFEQPVPTTDFVPNSSNSIICCDQGRALPVGLGVPPVGMPCAKAGECENARADAAITNAFAARFIG